MINRLGNGHITVILTIFFTLPYPDFRVWYPEIRVWYPEIRVWCPEIRVWVWVWVLRYPFDEVVCEKCEQK